MANTPPETGLIKILNVAIKKVPVVKYALGITGIAAAIGLIKSFGIGGFEFGLVGILTMFGLMILLFVFASCTTSKDKVIKFAGYLLVYFVVFVTIMGSLFILSCVFLKKPMTFETLAKQVSPSYSTVYSPQKINQNTIIDKLSKKPTVVFFKKARRLAPVYVLSFNSSDLSIQVREKVSGKVVASNKKIELGYDPRCLRGQPGNMALLSGHPVILVNGAPAVPIQESWIPNVGPLKTKADIDQQAHDILDTIPEKYIVAKIKQLLPWLK